MWSNIVQPERPQIVIWHMHIACWITKSTNTCSEYVILTDFLLQQWLYQFASLWCYMYIACLVCIFILLLWT